MIRHISLAISLALVASAPAAAAEPTHIGGFVTGPSVGHSVTAPATGHLIISPPAGTSTAAANQQSFSAFRQQQAGKPAELDLHLAGCVFCTGQNGGVGQQPN
jgi:hypothetical protein